MAPSWSKASSNTVIISLCTLWLWKYNSLDILSHYQTISSWRIFLLLLQSWLSVHPEAPLCPFAVSGQCCVPICCSHSEPLGRCYTTYIPLETLRLIFPVICYGHVTVINSAVKHGGGYVCFPQSKNRVENRRSVWPRRQPHPGTK